MLAALFLSDSSRTLPPDFQRGVLGSLAGKLRLAHVGYSWDVGDRNRGLCLLPGFQPASDKL